MGRAMQSRYQVLSKITYLRSPLNALHSLLVLFCIVCVHVQYSYETACEEYLKALDIIQKTSSEQEAPGSSAAAISAITIHFVINRVSLLQRLVQVQIGMCFNNFD